MSVCIVTRNAAGTINDAVDSAAALTEEIIVVDTGSTDDTQTVLRQYATEKKIIFHALPQSDNELDGAAARNECLKHATGAWIFVMDDTELLTSTTVSRIRALLEYEGADAYALTKRTYGRSGLTLTGFVDDDVRFREKSASCTHYTDVVSIRLFKNSKKSRFRYRVFETIEDSLVEQKVIIAHADILVHSFPRETPAQARARNEIYLHILEQEVLHAPDAKRFFDGAVLYEEFGQEDAALVWYKKAVDADHTPQPYPDALAKNTSLLFRLASAFLKKGQHEQAEFWLRKSLDLNPGFRNSYVVLAALFFHHSRPRSALHVLVRALKNNLKDVEMMNMVGFGLIQENKLDEAIKILDRTCAEAEGDSSLQCIDLIYNNRYTAYLLKGEGDAAIQILKQGITKYPAVASFYTNLINLFVQTNQRERALRYCQKALALDLAPDVRKHVENVEKTLKADSENK